MSRARSRPVRAVSGAGRPAFTMVEMLVVMGIITIVAAITVASHVSITRRNAREGAIETIMNTLRQARMSAVDSGRGAVVRIDPEARALYGLASNIEAAWHFEQIVDGETPGARGMDGVVSGAAIHPDGVLGLCLEFAGGDYVDCGRYPVYDQTGGIRLEAWVRPETGGGTILAKTDDAERGYAFYLDGDALAATFYARDDDDDDTPISISGGEVRTRRWSHVAVEFDGFEARLFVNDTLVERLDHEDTADGWEPPARIRPATRESLLIGEGFEGRIDEARLLSVAGGEPVELPTGVVLATSHQVIYFDGQGYLDVEQMGEDANVFVAVGDPYQRATLHQIDGDNYLEVRPENPFPTAGGMLLVASEYEDAEGNERIRYELVRYEGVDEDNPRRLLNLERALHEVIREEDGAAEHEEGSDVYFARLARVGPTGMVRRRRHDDD